MIVVDFMFLMLSVLICIGIVTQIIIPACLGKTLFPVFRKEKSALEERLIELNEQEASQKLQAQITAKEKQLNIVPVTPTESTPDSSIKP